MAVRFFHPLLALMASASRQELARQVAYLKEENRILRARLPNRIYTTPRERQRLIRAGRRLGQQLKELISIVSYSTFWAWVRAAEGRHAQRSENRRTNAKPGRPKTPEDIRELVLRIRRETSWGYTRIMGELRKLSIHLSRQTVRNILVENGLEPEPPSSLPESWDSFLARHAATLWQCDFVVKSMWTTRGFVDLYVLVFLHIGTRRCWISPCTPHPTSAWVAQAGREFLGVAEDMGLTPTMVMRDNAGEYTPAFDEVIRSAGAEIKRNTPWSPNLRAHVERFIQTFKRECLDHFLVIASKQMDIIGREFQTHYNRERPHSACRHLPPDGDHRDSSDASIAPSVICSRSRLGGLLQRYEVGAA